MSLPARYINIDTEDDEDYRKLSYRRFAKKDVPFYFIDKDPETGKRCAKPIKLELELDDTVMEEIPQIGAVRSERLYLIELISSRGSINEFSVRSPTGQRAKEILHDYLDKPSLNIIRQSTICEGV